MTARKEKGSLQASFPSMRIILKFYLLRNEHDNFVTAYINALFIEMFVISSVLNIFVLTYTDMEHILERLDNVYLYILSF